MPVRTIVVVVEDEAPIASAIAARLGSEGGVNREKVDTAYLFPLSDGAVPALANAGLTDPIDCDKPQPKGWAAVNLGRARANAVRNRPGVCQP